MARRLVAGAALLVLSGAVAFVHAADLANFVTVDAPAGAPLRAHFDFERVGGLCPQDTIMTGFTFERAGCDETRMWTDPGTGAGACSGSGARNETREGLRVRLRCASLVDDDGANPMRFMKLSAPAWFDDPASPYLPGHGRFSTFEGSCPLYAFLVGFRFLRGGCNATAQSKAPACATPPASDSAGEGLALSVACVYADNAQSVDGPSEVAGFGRPLQLHADFERLGGNCSDPTKVSARFSFRRGGFAAGLPVSVWDWAEGKGNETIGDVNAYGWPALEKHEGLGVAFGCGRLRGKTCSSSATLSDAAARSAQTTLPVMLMVVRDGLPVSAGSDRVLADFAIWDPKTGQNATVSGNLTASSKYSGTAAIRYRGQSSLRFDKLQFAFELRNTTNTSATVSKSLFDLNKDDDFVVAAPYADKSLVRNPIGFKLARDALHRAPKTKLIELYVAEGTSGPLFGGNLTASGDTAQIGCREYGGVYVLTEPVNRDLAKVAQATDADLTGGYIIAVDKIDHIGDPELLSTTSSLAVAPQSSVKIKYPGSPTPAQRSYLLSQLSALEDIRSAGTGKNFTETIHAFSFIQELLVHEFVMNLDAYTYSSFLTKERQDEGGRWRAGPTWDLNLAMGLRDENDVDGFVFDVSNRPGTWRGLMGQAPFACRAIARYNELRTGAWSLSAISALVQSYVAKLTPNTAGVSPSAAVPPDPASRNFAKWPILNKEVREFSVPNRNTYANEVAAVQKFFTGRAAWLDNAFATLPALRSLGSCQAELDKDHLLDLRLTEVMYASKFDFLEIKNVGTASVDLGRLVATQGVKNLSLTGAAELSAGGFAVFVRDNDLTDFQAQYPTVSVRATFSGKLSNGGERVIIEDSLYGYPVIAVDYNDKSPWPRADQCDKDIPLSLVIRDESSTAVPSRADPKNPSLWRLSSQLYGSPGASDPGRATSLNFESGWCPAKSFRGTPWANAATDEQNGIIHFAVNDDQQPAICRFKVRWGPNATQLTSEKTVYRTKFSESWITFNTNGTTPPYSYSVQAWYAPESRYTTVCATTDVPFVPPSSTPATGSVTAGGSDSVSDSGSAAAGDGAVVGIAVGASLGGILIAVAVVALVVLRFAPRSRSARLLRRLFRGSSQAETIGSEAESSGEA
jgi:CotH kinase protein